ncbi:hypothetical protein TPAR_06282, partial [Tolypocladium paradoxum]
PVLQTPACLSRQHPPGRSSPPPQHNAARRPTPRPVPPPLPRIQQAASRHVVEPAEPAAGGRAAHELCAHPVHGLYDVEGPLRGHRLAVPDRRRPLRVHGARLPARRPAPPLEPQRAGGDGRRRGGRVQRQGQGHPHCAPRGAQVWHGGQGQAAHQGRQQRGRRHGPVRARAGLPGARGHHRQRRRLRAVCGVRDDYAVGAPVAQDGHAGPHGRAGGNTAGVRAGQGRQATATYLHGNRSWATAILD